MTHIRLAGDQLVERRIRGLQQTARVARTLCGADATDRDLTLADGRRDLADGWQFLTCPDCRSWIERHPAPSRPCRKVARSGWSR
jgi:hypothetical protein